MINIEKLVNELMQAKEAYYNSQPIMNDFEFDSKEEDLKKLDPNNPYFSFVGYSAKGGKQYKHLIPMLSCGKAKTVEQVKDWMVKFKIETKDFVVMPKVDGLSGKIIYQNGKPTLMTTRGDGKIGQDISWLLDYMQDIPKEIDDKSYLEVKGEIYLPKNTTLDLGDRPLRNNATGLVARKDDREDCKFLHFVAYGIYNSDGNTTSNTFNDTLKYIKTLGFNKLNNFNYMLINYGDITQVFDDYKSYKRNDWIFETDGLVIQLNDCSLYNSIDSQQVVDHHHHFNIALKPEPERGATILRGIDWQVSRFGKLIPVAVFDKIILCGREIDRASLANYQNVKNLDLRVGDTIYVILANDVIPYFEKVIIKNEIGESLLIENCPCCGTPLIFEGLDAVCKNELCQDRLVKQISSWCKKSEMDNISESTIRTLLEKGFISNVKDLYFLKNKKEQLLNVDGFGQLKVDNLLQQIEKSKSMNIVQFINRLGIELVGEKAIKKLGINTIKDFWNFSNCQYKIEKNLIDYRNDNKEFLTNLLEVITVEDSVMTDSNLPKVCMTGKGPDTRKNLIAKIEEKGYTFVDSITKDTNILICEDVNGTSSKLVKARKLGIKLRSYEEFFK